MKAKFRNLLFTSSLSVVSALLTGVPVQATPIDTAFQITAGGATCLIGDCTTGGLQAGALNAPGNAASIPTTPFSVNFTFGNTDQYNFSGNYTSSYGVSGSSFVVNVVATFVGNTSLTNSQGDAFTLDFFQDFFDSTGTSWSGVYSESVPITIGNTTGPSSSVSAQLYYNGLGVGLIGPFTGPGNYSGFQSTNLSGPSMDNTNYLAADFQFNYVLTAGAQPGSTVSNFAPEPAETIPMAIAFGVFVCVIFMKKKKEQIHEL